MIPLPSSRGLYAAIVLFSAFSFSSRAPDSDPSVVHTPDAASESGHRPLGQHHLPVSSFASPSNSHSDRTEALEFLLDLPGVTESDMPSGGPGLFEEHTGGGLVSGGPSLQKRATTSANTRRCFMDVVCLDPSDNGTGERSRSNLLLPIEGQPGPRGLLYAK